MGNSLLHKGFVVAAAGLALLGVSTTAHAGKREDEYARALSMATSSDPFERLVGREALATMFPRLRDAQQKAVQAVIDTGKAVPVELACTVQGRDAGGFAVVSCDKRAASPAPAPQGM